MQLVQQICIDRYTKKIWRNCSWKILEIFKDVVVEYLKNGNNKVNKRKVISQIF